MNQIKERIELDVLIKQMSSYCSFLLVKTSEEISPTFDRLIIKRNNERIKEALDLTYKYGSMPLMGLKILPYL